MFVFYLISVIKLRPLHPALPHTVENIRLSKNSTVILTSVKSESCEMVMYNWRKLLHSLLFQLSAT